MSIASTQSAPPGRRVELTRLRRAIARGMTGSAAIPQFAIEFDADLRALTDLRRTLAADLSCDHRVVDGAPAALFLRDLVARLEDPDWVREALG